MPIVQPIPTQLQKNGKQYAEGYCTPKSLDTVQVASFAPERVIPVVFLPGIMGSSLRMGAARQTQLQNKNNVAWRPDDRGWGAGMLFTGARERQLQLDPQATVVDVYDPQTNPTGNAKETADHRNNFVKVTAETPLLRSDPPLAKDFRSATRKARERGWGEIFFDSYGPLLNTLETRLNLAFQNGKLNPEWKDVVDVDPARWQPADNSKTPPLTEKELKRVMTNCFYPVHAFGYNWLQSNGEAASEVAKRIRAMMEDYREKGFRCEKVIVVTHSMGGLVGRALCHPAYGNLEKEILGIVHGVMPAIGAAAAYRRMRAGFEGGGIVTKVLGDNGPNVTAVLANAPGGLQLLPSEAYGNHWLRIVTQSGKVLKSLPEKGDPYREVYPRADVWWGLFREQWINPAGQAESGLDNTLEYLAEAKKFHRNINNTFHPVSYAHYGCDPKQPAFEKVIWEVSDAFPLEKIDALYVGSDDLRGNIMLRHSPPPQLNDKALTFSKLDTTGISTVQLVRHEARMKNPADPGDKTVPMHSADHQLRSGKFKSIFRQTGYEHQDSYKDTNAVACTLYSIIRIAQHMDWWDK